MGGLRGRLAVVPAIVIGLAGCRAPSRDIRAEPGDFALIEVQLRG